MKPSRRISTASNERTEPPFPAGRWQRWRARIAAFHLRDSWWRLLDFFEASRAARLGLYLAASAVLSGAALWYWAYPAWTRHSATRIAREWLAAGQLRYAAEAAQKAAAADPDNPEPWLIAAELARLGGQYMKALIYCRHAAGLTTDNPAVIIAWAAAALRADQPAEADRALDRLPIEQQAASPHVQRLRGEMARRSQHLTVARNFFEAARRLEGSAAINEVPLGLILLIATDPAERQRGLALLGKWKGDREWGETALRTLLDDALIRHDAPATRQWAEALRLHPGCTIADMAQCLLALARVDEPHYAEVLAALKKDHAVSPQAAAQLLSWLNQIGRGADAVAWMRTLPADALQRPPLAVAAAEALRQTGDWSALKGWTDGKDWGKEANFMRWTYGLQAAHQLGENNPADELWRTLYSHAQVHGAHGLFAASQLYSWGMTREAEELWWRVAEQEGQVAIEALGSLARHYQVKRDAEGQYRVFRQLNLLRPQDAAIGNNFAFFAALTSRDLRNAEKIARANLAGDPHNPVYLATDSFVLFMQKRTGEARSLLTPSATEAGRSPALAFAYGLALAATGDKAAAHRLLDPLPPASLTLREEELIRDTLAE
jgi:predicted Zn-dependent protease